MDSDGDLCTPLVENKQCAYVFRDDRGITKCAVEKAFLNDETNFRKPPPREKNNLSRVR